MPLTPDEKDTLTALEHQLRADDPALAAALAGGPRRVGRPHEQLLWARQIALLIGALLVLAMFGPVIADQFGTLALGVMTGSLIVPWLITSVRAGSHRPDPASPMRTPKSDERDALTE